MASVVRDIELVVETLRYSGWKSVRVTRSIESLAGSFALVVSDRWDGIGDPWPVAEEDECRVEIERVPVIDGYVDKRDLDASPEERTLSYSGRDRAAALVDCSAVLKKWTYRNISLADFVATLAKPFGVSVSVQPGLSLPKMAKLTVAPGDTPYEAIKREAGESGVLLVSDGAGGILITRAGATRATSLIERQNILRASVSYDGSERFYRYVVLSQTPGTDEASGDATRIQAEAFDEGVRRKDRVLMLRPGKGFNNAEAKRYADWEARVRAARAETVNVTVFGWKQPSGALWPLNARCHVKAPTLIGVDGDLIISQLEHTIGKEGRVTQIRLVRPDAFTPEPTKAKVKASGGAWKELDKGGL